jgi:riboflavin kinase / FMN adenylyltransferase
LKLIDASTQLQGDIGPSVVTIGSFDGFHLGHQFLLARARQTARRLGAQAGVLTFEPHPARALAPGLSPPMLLSKTRKRKALQSLEMDFALVQPFDLAFASLTVTEFAKFVLQQQLKAKAVVVGDDFTFGKARTGRAEDLINLGQQHGFEVEVLRRLSVEGITVSSTAIRSFILQGKVEGAALLLGRPYLIEGTVVTGLGRGRKLGFPTANLQTSAELLPSTGVYLCHVWLQSCPNAKFAVTNVGVSPTFGPGVLRVEVHLLDPIDDLVGQRMAVAFLERVRPEQVFSTVKALIAQIDLDVESAKHFFAKHPERPLCNSLDGVDLNGG